MKSAPILQLSAGQLDQWLEVWQSSSAPTTAFLHPAYARATARSGAQIIVGMGEDGSGFLPLEVNGGRGQAVGSRLADFSGAVWLDDASFQPHALLQACGLREWVLQNCVGIAAQAGNGYHLRAAPSIDLSEGMDGWFADLRSRGASSYRNLIPAIAR